MKASIKGNIVCNCDEDLKTCTKTLDEFNVTHTLDGMSILIDTFIKVTGWFNRDGFENMLRRKLSHYGKGRIDVSDMMM